MILKALKLIVQLIFIVAFGASIDYLCVEFFHHEPTFLDFVAVLVVYSFIKIKTSPSTPKEESAKPCEESRLILPVSYK